MASDNFSRVIFFSPTWPGLVGSGPGSDHFGWCCLSAGFGRIRPQIRPLWTCLLCDHKRSGLEPTWQVEIQTVGFAEIRPFEWFRQTVGFAEIRPFEWLRQTVRLFRWYHCSKQVLYDIQTSDQSVSDHWAFGKEPDPGNRKADSQVAQFIARSLE